MALNRFLEEPPLENSYLQLQKALENASLSRKAHWGLLHRAIRSARRSIPKEEEITILNDADAKFFDDWQVLKFPIVQGTLLFLLLTFAIEIAYWLLLPMITDPLFAVMLYGTCSYFALTSSHVVFHWLFGRSFGIKFRSYFVFRSTLRKSRIRPLEWLALFPTPGIKYDLSSFLRAAPLKRTVMFISAPVLQGAWFIINFVFLLQYFSLRDPLLLVTGLLTVLFLVGNILPSYLWGDLRKARMDY
ncbi:MAG: hypothetical protein JSV05_03400 [Candidatus Bathyarchaeota archaeon]|nr:MAG: hypothetical protein JSV05_03400 [Candidatus Bathyarchaeota archaeon]